MMKLAALALAAVIAAASGKSGTPPPVPPATTTHAGTMSAADKVKLDSLTPYTPPGDATPSASGLMSADDKAKLDAFPFYGTAWRAPSFAATDTVSAVLLGRTPDGPTAVGVKIGNTNALSGTAKIAAFYSDNGTTERAWIGNDGSLWTAGPLAAASVYTGTEGIVEAQHLRAPDGGGPLEYRATTGNGAASIAHRFTNATSITTSGAKLASFYSDDGATERSFIDRTGAYYSKAADGDSGVGCVNDGCRVVLGSAWLAGYSGVVYTSGTLSVNTSGTGTVNAATLAPTNNVGLTLAGKVSDGATAVAIKFQNGNALNNASAKLAAFYSDNGSTEQAYIGYRGTYVSKAASSNDGFRCATEGCRVNFGGAYLYGFSGSLYSSADVFVGNNGAGTAWANTLSPGSNGNTLTLKGRITDGASSVAIIMDNPWTFATSGSKLLSVRNNTVEKAYIDKDGGYKTSTGDMTANSLSASLVTSSGDVRANYFAANAGVPASIMGWVNNSDTSIVAKIGSYNTQSYAGARILSIYRDTFATEVATVDRDGFVRIGIGNTAALPTCDATIRGKIAYSGGGAGVKDTVSVCAKDAADAYAWRTIY